MRNGDEITEVTTENLPQYSANHLVLSYTETLIPEHQSWNIGNLERASMIFDVVSSLPRDPAQTRADPQVFTECAQNGF